jgi:hypothetical protein
MALSHELVSEFAKLVNEGKKTNAESTVYGTIMTDSNGNKYVKLDGSDQLTPISEEENPSVDSSTASVNEGDRVSVLIKNHTATVTGNISSPSARSEDLERTELKVHELDMVMAYSVSTEDLTAINATIENLKAVNAEFLEIDAVKAAFDSLEAKFANVDHISASDMEVVTANIQILKSEFAEFKNATVEDLEVFNAYITNLEGTTANFKYLTVDELNARYVHIDFANIDKAWMQEFYSRSGIIQDLESEDGSFTGELVGVLIKGDLIEAGTLKVDRLVIKGTDGNYYQLSTDFTGLEAVTPVTEDMIHGSVMVAESITADKIKVSDLSAFRATIGGFHIGDGESGPRALYSDVKNSVDNTTRGIFLDAEGEFNFGDSNNYIKFHKVVDADGNDVLDDNGEPMYRLSISAESILFGQDKSSTADLKARMDKIKMGSYVDENGETHPYIELGGEDPAVNFVASGFTDNEYGMAQSIDNFTVIKDKTYKVEVIKTDGSYATSVIITGSGWDGNSSPGYVLDGNTEFVADHDGDGYAMYIYDSASDIASASLIEIRGANSPTIFKQRLTNKQAIFSDDDTPTIIDSDGVDTENVTVRGEFRQGGLAWTTRKSGKYIHYGLMWKGVTS